MVAMFSCATLRSGAECGKSCWVWDKLACKAPLFPNSRFWHHFSWRLGLNSDIMEILMIVLIVVGAYVLFVTTCYVLARLLFPRIEVDDSDEALPVRTRNVNRYASTRTLRKQKNLAY